MGEEEGLREAELLPVTVELTEAVALAVPVLLRVAGPELEALEVPLTVPLAVLLTVGEAEAEREGA